MSDKTWTCSWCGAVRYSSDEYYMHQGGCLLKVMSDLDLAHGRPEPQADGYSLDTKESVSEFDRWWDKCGQYWDIKALPGNNYEKKIARKAWEAKKDIPKPLEKFLRKMERLLDDNKFRGFLHPQVASDFTGYITDVKELYRRSEDE